MRFLINNESREYHGDPELSLLKYLRQQENITSLKDGCAPQAACGCCTVELNARAVLACAVPMKKVADGKVVTIEGLEPDLQKVFADAFAAKSGAQCGFCIPGIVMRAKVLLDKNSDPNHAQIVKALTSHLCRCTGYKKIIDSILLVAKARKTKKPIMVDGKGEIGGRLAKYGVHDLVLGKHKYVADLREKSLLHGALKFSDHPRAKVLAIEIEEASKLQGVHRIFTAKDIPGNRYTGLVVQDWPLMIAVGETTRYIGDVLAAVVAETEDIARKVLTLIEIEYQVQTPVTDARKALEMPAVHQKGNLLSQTIIKRGECDKALKQSAYTAGGIFETQFIEHGFMETECCLARPWGKGIEVFSQGQGIYEDRKQITSLLALEQKKVKVVLVPNGGGFGGKEDLTVQGHAALCSYLLQKPVRFFLSRDESIIMHPKRHPFFMEYQVGCDKQGKLTALKASIIGDTGAYASVGMKVVERGAGHATGAYHIPVAEIKAQAIYTNNIPCGAMRGFGVNQVTFALESCIDELCEKGGFDRWQFRYDNAIVEGKITATGQIIEGGSGLRATLQAVEKVFRRAPYSGIACGIKNTGVGNGKPDSSKVKIEFDSDKVTVHHGWTEMGQGVHTVVVQILCHELAIPAEIIEVRVETTAEAHSGMTTASRATSLVGNAMLNACRKIKEELGKKDWRTLAGKTYSGEWHCDWTTKPGAEGKPITHYSYSYATQVVVLNEKGKVEKIYAAHDAGKIINRNLFEGQIEGSIHMGLGYALSENLSMENGRPLSTRLRKCGILRAKEMPEIEVIGIEEKDAHGPYGAKGVGEIGLVPTAAALANACYQFDKQRRYQLPFDLPGSKKRK